MKYRDAHIGVVTTPEVKAALLEMCARKSRTMSQYVHLLLERELLGKGPDGREGQAERDNGAGERRETVG